LRHVTLFFIQKVKYYFWDYWKVNDIDKQSIPFQSEINDYNLSKGTGLFYKDLKEFKVKNIKKYGRLWNGFYHEFLEICFLGSVDGIKKEALFIIDLEKNDITKVIFLRVALTHLHSYKKGEGCPNITKVKNNPKRYFYFFYNKISNSSFK